MPRIQYKDIFINEEKHLLIKAVNLIVAEYDRQGYKLTLRQIYYQFVAKDLLPSTWADPATGSTNNIKSYKKLGDIISDGRLAGLIDWKSVEDRTRELAGNSHWDNPQQIIRAISMAYKIDHWEGQHYRPEVWVEKDALEDVVGRACRELDIPYFSCRGYTSQTAMWDAGRRLKDIAEDGNIPVIIHLGDHDPSGIDMSRDIKERIELFMELEGGTLEFKRIALNMDQVEEWRPPENPAKVTDPRAKKYIQHYGESSWELDALEPRTIDDLIKEAISEYVDTSLIAKRVKKEQSEKALIDKVAADWDNIIATIQTKKGKRK